MPYGQLKKAIQRIKQERAMAKKSEKVTRTEITVHSQQTPVEQFQNALARVSEAFSGKIQPAKAAAAFAELKNMSDMLEKIEKTARSMILSLIEKEGQQVTDAGTLQVQFGDYMLEARPQRTGFDSKKVEALIRAKEMDPAQWMDTQITYTMNTTKLAQAMTEKKLTKEEVETCRYEKSYAVQKPKRIE